MSWVSRVLKALDNPSARAARILLRSAPAYCIVALSASTSAWGQPLVPKPYPSPRPSTAKTDRSVPPLTPVENVWVLALNNLLTLPPAYDGTQVFLSIEGNRLVAYDLTSGSRSWMVAAQPEVAPVAGGGLVFVREPDSIRALHAGDGSVAWELPVAEKLAIDPVWDNGWLVLSLATGEIRALRDVDGQRIWSRNLESPAHAAPAFAADRLYVPTTDRRIVALNVENGEVAWERRLGGAPNEILAFDDRLYAGAKDNFFYCIMAEDGRIDWRWRTGGDIIGKAVADEKYVYFVALDNVLRAMNRVTGGQQWMKPLPFRPAYGPVKAGSTIVVGGQTPPLRVFNLKDGVAAGTLTGVAPRAEAPDPPEPTSDKADAKKAPASFPPLTDAEVAAAPYALEDPLTHMPRLLMLFKEIARGGSATLVTHSIEPALVPAVSALPNLIQIAPVTPTTPSPRP